LPKLAHLITDPNALPPDARVEEAIAAVKRQGVESMAALAEAASKIVAAQTLATNELKKASRDSGATIAASMPNLDLSQVISQVKAIPQPDNGPLLAELRAVMAAIDSIEIPETDLTDLMLSQKLLALEVNGLEFPKTDLSAITKRLESIEADIAELKKPKTFEFDIQRINSIPTSPIKKVTARQV